MKKFLLSAVAALAVCTAGAQTFGTQLSGKPLNQSRIPSMKQTTLQSLPSVPLQSSKIRLEKNNDKPLSLAPITNKSIKQMGTIATQRRLNAAPRKAEGMLESYLGTCSDNTGEALVWTMTPVEVTDEAENIYPGFEDLVPNPFEEAGVEHLYVAYTIEGSNITIPAQYVTSLEFNDGTANSIWITNYSASSEDGSIPMTIDGDGMLTMGTSYVAFVGLPADATEFSFDDMEWYWNYYTNIKYQNPANIPVPSPVYAYDDLVLYSGISANGYSFNYQHIMTPAYAPVNTANYTSDVADNWTWSTYTLDYDETIGEEGEFVKDELYASGDSKSYSYVPIPENLYAPTELVASYKGQASDPFFDADDDALVYASANGANWGFGDGTYPLVSRSNIKYGIAYYRGMGTDDGIRDWIIYQGKPTSPLYFEGVRMLTAAFSYEKTFNLKCKIQEVTRNASGRLSLGEVIAESAVDIKSINTTDWGATELVWHNFKAIDDLGFESDLDYLQIDTEFAIVIEGWDNGTFSGYPLCDEGPDSGRTTSYVTVPEDEDAIYSFSTYYGHLMVGFLNPVYGYLHTEDNTKINLPTEGGEASIHVTPMFVSVDDETGDPTYRLFIDKILVDDEELDEIPEWLTISVANEDYTTDEDGYILDVSYDLVFAATALPEGEENRSCQIEFMQEGAKLVINIIQGTVLEDVSSLAAFKALEANTEARLTLNDAIVTYANGRDVYVQDATGALEFYNTGLSLEAGKVVNGTVIGKLSIYNDLPEFVKTDNTNADNLVFTDGTVEVTDMTVAQALKAESISMLVKISDIEIAESDGKFYVKDGDDLLQIYDKFKVISSDFSYPEKANITGIICIFKGTMQIMPISEESIEKIVDLQPADFADGKYFLGNIATERFWGAGNDWGTRASLVEHPEYVTLLKQPDGTYFLESQVSNGGTNYYFGGDYMDGQPVALTIMNVGIVGYSDDEETQPVYGYTIASDGNYFGWDGESTVLGKNIDSESENALWEIISYDDAVAALALATEDDPIDATFLIQDPNFGRNHRYQSAWTMDASNQNLSGGNNINNCAESWRSAFTLSQKVSVPTGKYIITAQAALTDYTDAYDGADHASELYRLFHSHT